MKLYRTLAVMLAGGACTAAIYGEAGAPRVSATSQLDSQTCAFARKAEPPIPNGKELRFLSIDPKTGDLLISYPESIYSASSNPQHTEVIRLGNHVEPEVVVEVQRDDAGMYQYKYTVTNGSAARQPIRAWEVILPGSTVAQRIDVPQFWLPATMTATPLDSRAAAYLNPPGYWMSSFSVGKDEVRGTPEGAGDIAPGSAAVFEIDGRGKPGFVLNLFDDGDPTINTYVNQQPQPVFEEITTLMLLGRISQQRWLLGPVFEPDAASDYVAKDLSCAVTLRVRNHQVDRGSEFVREVEKMLQRYEAGPSGAGPTPNSSPVRFRNKPATEMERQLEVAVTMSLLARSNGPSGSPPSGK